MGKFLDSVVLPSIMSDFLLKLSPFQLSGIKKLEQRLNMILFKMKFPEEMQDIKPVSIFTCN